jgi:hypothetical protein
MALAENKHVIQALAPDRADEALCEGILQSRQLQLIR